MTLDLRQPVNSVKVETGIGAEGKYWRIGDGNQDGFNEIYQFTAVKKVAKSEITRANYHLGFAAFKRLHQQAGKKEGIQDWMQGTRQLNHLFIQEITNKGVVYYQAKFEYMTFYGCYG